ncbi:MAG: hypothetical protein WAN46_10505 [Gammaproteobacteria bacterium]|jgi:hypothetical protein
MHKQTIWVDARMARKLKVIAARTGTTMLELASAALKEYLENIESSAGEALPSMQGMPCIADESL